MIYSEDPPFLGVPEHCHRKCSLPIGYQNPLMSHWLYLLMLNQNSTPGALTAREHGVLITIRMASQYFYSTIPVNPVYCKFNLKKMFYCCAKSSGQTGGFMESPTSALLGDPYLFKRFFGPSALPFSGSPVHALPFLDLKCKNQSIGHGTPVPSAARPRVKCPRLAAQPARRTWEAPGGRGGPRGAGARGRGATRP